MTATQGLEGVVATETSISSIIDDTLTYVGYDIDDLAENASFEEVVYLLWHKRLTKSRRTCGIENNNLQKIWQFLKKYLNHFKTYPIEKVHPMAALRTAVSMLALYDDEAEDMSDEANYLKAIQLQAKMPTFVTAFSRIRKGLRASCT